MVQALHSPIIIPYIRTPYHTWKGPKGVRINQRGQMGRGQEVREVIEETVRNCWHSYTPRCCLPLYSMGFPFLKNLMVGYPLTPYSCPKSFSSVASTFPSLISEPSSRRAPAAFAYSGASALQWPHQGASRGRAGNGILGMSL